MHTRISEIRKKNNLTQEQFSKRMGISKNYVNLIENGRKTPGDRLVSDICREFNVNETGLRTGEDDPVLPRTRNQIITDFTADLLREENDSFRRRFIEALSILDVNDWKTLEKIAEALILERSERNRRSLAESL